MALEKAKGGLTQRAVKNENRGDADNTGWDTAVQRWTGRSGGVGVKLSKTEQRRDLLKRSIRVVGQADPNALALAETLGAVDLGRIKVVNGDGGRGSGSGAAGRVGAGGHEEG